MGLTHLLEALERDAQGEIDRLRTAARTEADAIAAASTARLDERRRLALEEVDRRQRHELEQALTTARRAARRSVLEARQSLMQRVLAEARGLLSSALRLETYRNELPAALALAFSALGEGPVVIRCTPALRESIDALVRTPEVTVVADDSVGSGFLAQVPDGSVAVVDTLEERLERRRPELARWVFAQFGDGE